MDIHANSFRIIRQFNFTVTDANHACRNADNGGVVRYIFDDHSVGTDANIIPDANIANNASTGSDIDVVTKNRRVAFFGADGDTVFDGDVAAALDAGVDDEADAVKDDEAGPKLSAAADHGVSENGVELAKNRADKA